MTSSGEVIGAATAAPAVRLEDCHFGNKGIVVANVNLQAIGSKVSAEAAPGSARGTLGGAMRLSMRSWVWADAAEGGVLGIGHGPLAVWATESTCWPVSALTLVGCKLGPRK